MRADQIIIEPILTEKTNILKDNPQVKYVFKVHPKANKYQISKAIKDIFAVQPVSCNIINVKAKAKTQRTKSGVTSGKIGPWKKAIVTLAKGEKIAIFEGV